jgi:nicotinamidase-related amidase
MINMVNDFIRKYGKLFIRDGRGKIILPIQKKLDKFQKRKNLVFYICDHHRSNDKEFILFHPNCLSGTEGDT